MGKLLLGDAASITAICSCGTLVCTFFCIFLYFLRKIVSAINVSILCVNITKLFFVCLCIKFDFSYFKQINSIN